MGALQQFTSDKNQLYAAIERVKYNPAGPRWGRPPSPQSRRGGRPAGMNSFRDEYFTRGTIGALTS